MTPEKKAILCPNCKRLVGADEDRCPYCGHSQPGSVVKQHVSRAVRKYENLYTTAVLYTCIGMFVLSLLLNPGRMGLTLNPLQMLSPSSDSLILLGATGTIPIDRFGRWWTLISANYLHGGILHILFNMFAFRQIASLAGREFGPCRMFIIFSIGGIAGFVLSYFAGVHLTIGASAGICALIGASLYYGKSRGGLYGQVIFRQIGGWVIGLFIFGLLIPGINNWGHGGGLLSGALLGFLLGYQEKVPESMIHRFLAAGCASVTVIVLFWSVGTGIYFSLIAH